MKKGLILEGGAMRGIYTAGVLDVFMENFCQFDGVIGVSAGAIHGSGYISGQMGRSIRYYSKYMNDPRFLSWKSFFKTGNICGEDFCYHEIPENLDPFDYEAFKESPMKFYVVMTNLKTGRAEYVHVKDLKAGMDYLLATSSMPAVSHIVKLDGKAFLDGGIADSIPVRAFEKMGYERNVAVLTRAAGYKKKKPFMPPFRMLYGKEYPKFVDAMEKRCDMYNAEVEDIERQENEGKLFVIRPSENLGVGRLEKNPQKIMDLYRLGVNDARDSLERMKKFLFY
jgi:predicted patatin/cPLA2 family phospholipase